MTTRNFCGTPEASARFGSANVTLSALNIAMMLSSGVPTTTA